MTLNGTPGINEGKQTYVTTTDCCGECGAKLLNAETARLDYQREAAKLERQLKEAEWIIQGDCTSEWFQRRDAFLAERKGES